MLGISAILIKITCLEALFTNVSVWVYIALHIEPVPRVIPFNAQHDAIVRFVIARNTIIKVLVCVYVSSRFPQETSSSKYVVQRRPITIGYPL
jgi:hypothetical protein